MFSNTLEQKREEVATRLAELHAQKRSNDIAVRQVEGYIVALSGLMVAEGLPPIILDRECIGDGAVRIELG